MNRDDAVQWVVYPVAIAVMIGCIVATTVQLLAAINPALAAEVLVPLSGLAAIEGYVVTRLLARLPLGSAVTPWHIRAVELTAWLLVLQIIADLQTGRAPLNAGTVYIAPVAVVQFVVIAACWWVATISADDLINLDEVVPWSPLYVPRAERLTRRFFRGGALLFLAAGLAAVGTRHLSRLADPTRPAISGVVGTVLLYFALGVALLIQIRHERLRRAWRRREVAVPPGMTLRWLRYTVALLLAGLLIAVILPTGYSPALLDTLRTALNAVVAGVFTVIGILLTPLFWLLSLLHLQVNPQSTPPPGRAPARPPRGPAPVDLTFLRTLLFWLIVGVILVALARTYGHMLSGRRAANAGRLLGAWLRGMWIRLRQWLLGFPATSHRVRQRSAPATAPRVRARRQRRARVPWFLAPRDRVIWYYAGMLERAARAGHPRHTGQTPAEFDAALRHVVPDAGADLDRLTEAYIAARYAPQPVTAERSRAVREPWRRVIAALRHARPGVR